ncbi:MAG TPA: D-alanyl-D-alanine carboxypeptidase family protein [Solirubrobacteraceae bacterium]|nr:D-alanyl-D-alanine carboxypeptidase family protein [Solirubrobacteraceae bacterium]
MLAAIASCASPAGALVKPPHLHAKAAIVIESESGDALLRRHADKRRPIASTTKLMTALLTLERGSLRERLTVPHYRAGPGESTIGLHPGEHLTVRDLLRALLLPSANDAAATLAQGVAGSRRSFVRAMNRRARRLHLSHTHYASPVGLDDRRNYSSASDLVALARVDLGNRFFAATVKRTHATLRSGRHRRQIVNRNRLVAAHHWITGVKTGHTRAAGFCLVGSATRHGVTVLSAVLGDPSEATRDADTLALLRYGLRSYRHAVLVPAGRMLAQARARGGDGKKVALVTASRASGELRRGTRPVISVAAPRALNAPLAAGTRVGTVTVRVAGRVIARVPLVTARRLTRIGTVERVRRALAGPIGIGALAFVAGGSLLVAMHRRRRLRTERRRRQGRVGAA